MNIKRTKKKVFHFSYLILFVSSQIHFNSKQQILLKKKKDNFERSKLH